MCALYQLGGCALKNAWIWPLPRWYKWFYGIPANNKMKPCCARMPAQNGINVSISLTNRFKWKPFPSGMLYVSGWFFFFSISRSNAIHFQRSTWLSSNWYLIHVIVDFYSFDFAVELMKFYVECKKQQTYMRWCIWFVPYEILFMTISCCDTVRGHCLGLKHF